MSGEHRYQPFFCEENVWWLGRRDDLATHPRWIVFVTNAERRCALLHQRAVEEGRLVLWDYHVILVVSDGGLWVWDLDSRLGAPIALDAYLDATFEPRLPADLHPRFHVVGADAFYATFASDRRHMRDADRWLQPPPPWAPVGEGSTLERFLDLDERRLGRWCDRDQLRPALAELADGHSK